jgi:hypothetical protein
LERLSVAAAQQAAPPAASSHPVEKVDENRLQSLAQSHAPSPVPAKPAPVVDLNKANEKLSALLGKPKEK